MTEPNPTILMVDDDVTLLASLGAQLERAGYRVLKASEVAGAELLFVEQQPDLVLLEVGSTDGAGWALLERLAPMLPVVVLSSLGLEEQVVRGLDAGAADYVTKPYRSGELLARLRLRLEEARRFMPSPVPGPVAATHVSPGAPAPLQVPTVRPAAASLPTWAGEADATPAPPERTARARANDEEEPVFIDSASEAALLAAEMHARQPDRQLDAQLDALPLGQRLSTARHRRQLSLVQAEIETKIRMWYLQAMEEEKFAMLPRGEGSEQLVRTYATYLGLDAARAVEEFRTQHYNPPPQPLAALGGSPLSRRLPRWPLFVLTVVLALAVSIGAILLIDPLGAQTMSTRIAEWLRALLAQLPW
jgi:DNA-binding response OmpR family regulator